MAKVDNKRARAAAKRARMEAEREAARRRERWFRVAIAVVIVIAIAVVGVIIQNSRTSVDEDAARPTGVTEAGGGLLAAGPASADAPLLEVYEDFRCPHCADFEAAVGDTLDEIATSGQARVLYRIVSFIDDDSTRAQAAAGCAADAGGFDEYHDVLFAHQQDGFSIDQLVSYGAEAGLTSPTFEQCVRDQTYESWANASTQAMTERGVNGTPTVFVNGEELSSDQYTREGLLAAINATR